MKKCAKCQQELPETSFWKSKLSADKLSYRCVSCLAEDRKEIKARKKDNTFVNKSRQPRLTEEQREIRSAELLEYHKNYRKVNKEKLSANKAAEKTKAKIEGILHYGGKCSCCGESITEFLTLEHLTGRDKTKKRRTGKEAWLQAKREGFPDIYTVLCFNCNCAKGAFGICPHKKEQK